MIFEREQVALSETSNGKYKNQYFICIKLHFIVLFLPKSLFLWNYLQTAMFKLTLICLALLPLIIGSLVENPKQNETRVGKFFGLMTGKSGRNSPSQLLWSLLLSGIFFELRRDFLVDLKIDDTIRLEFPNNWVSFSYLNV